MIELFELFFSWTYDQTRRVAHHNKMVLGDVLSGITQGLTSIFTPPKKDLPTREPLPAALTPEEYKRQQDDAQRERDEKMIEACKNPLSLCPRGYHEIETSMPTKKIGNRYYYDPDITTEKKKYCYNYDKFAHCSLDPKVYGDEWGTVEESGRIEIKRGICRGGVGVGIRCDDMKGKLCDSKDNIRTIPEGETFCKVPRLGTEFCNIMNPPDPGTVFRVQNLEVKY